MIRRASPALVAFLVACSEAPPPHAAAVMATRAPIVDGGAASRVPLDARARANVARQIQTAKPDAQADADRGESREQRLVARTLERVSHVRGLASKKAVPGVVLGRDALIARVRKHVDQEVPHEAIVDEGLVQQLLGFIPARFDYEAETYALLTAQLAGFYEPADGTMYLAADLDDATAAATLAHELVHALQDQHWDLGPRSKYAPGQDDRLSAFSALAEGDATSAMADLLVGTAKPGTTALDLPEELFTDQIIGGMSAGPTSTAPHVMRMSLVAPYIDGTLFVHALRRKGGWTAVNRAWENPPTTTEQILHVAKWEAHEPPLPVDDPPFASLGPGWTVAEDDTYGELGVRLSLDEWIGPARAGIDAAGWGGDRGALVKNGSAYAFAWRVRYDDAKPKPADAYAARAFADLAPAIERLGAHRSEASPAHQGARAEARSFVCIERGELGPLAVERRGRDLVIVAGPANVSTKGWTSAGRCTKSRAWCDEIEGR